MEAIDFTRAFVSSAGMSGKVTVKALIIVEELVSNVFRHRQPAQDVHLTLSLDAENDEVRIELDDDSVAFDASLEGAFSGPDPDHGGSVGLAIVRAWSEGMSYARNEGRNTLALKVK